MLRPANVLRSKEKIAIELQTSLGSTLEGHVYVEGSERVLDLLNRHERFLPLEMDDGKVVLLNKNAISQIVPSDEEWMTTPVE